MRKTFATLTIAGLAVATLSGYTGYQAANGDDTPSENVQVASAARQSAAAATPAPAATPSAPQTGSGTTISVVDNPDLGQILVDAEGFTLYRFDKDTADPSSSACEGECAATWPVAESPANWKDLTVTGIDRSVVKFFERTDGTCQLTVAGWPVYRFAADAKPGDVKGHGVGGTWFAVTPDGKKASGDVSQPDAVPAKPVPSSPVPSNAVPSTSAPAKQNGYSSGY